MQRKVIVDPPDDREEVAFPCEIQPYRPQEITDSRVSRYLPGDLIFFNSGTSNRPALNVARIISVKFQQHFKPKGFVPRYQVQIMTKGGYWSNNWRFITSAHIHRADQQPRQLPRVLSEPVLPVLKYEKN